ncbi:MAG: tripartite tricarboxylate transporter substrate binding protein [Alcaligenaceae bacterium]
MKQTTLPARRVLTSLFSVLAFTVCALAQAQTATYPSKPTTIIVPFGPGTLTDVLARIVASKLSLALAQPVVVENKAGADGNIGAAFVASAPADGYTLMVGSTSIGSINVTLHKNIKYDPQRDFIGITNLVSVPNVLVIGPQVEAKNIKELLALQKAKSFSYGSSGAGGSMHLSGEIFKKMAQVEMVHVPYKSSPAVINDIIGGRVEMMFCNLPICLSLIQSGKLTALGVTSAKRSELLPEVPTIAEAGLAGYEVSGWFGLYAPKATPLDIVEKLNLETVKILNDPQIKAQLLAQGAVTIGDTSAHFNQYALEERHRWAKIIQDAGIVID